MHELTCKLCCNALLDSVLRLLVVVQLSSRQPGQLDQDLAGLMQAQASLQAELKGRLRVRAGCLEQNAATPCFQGHQAAVQHPLPAQTEATNLCLRRANQIDETQREAQTIGQKAHLLLRINGSTDNFPCMGFAWIYGGFGHCKQTHTSSNTSGQCARPAASVNFRLTKTSDLLGPGPAAGADRLL